MLAQISPGFLSSKICFSRGIAISMNNSGNTEQKTEQKTEKPTAIPKSDQKKIEKIANNIKESSKTKELEKEISRLQEENKKIKKDSLYLAADLANARRIFREEINAMQELAAFKLGSELLPALDNLARIEQAGEKQKIDDLLKGVKIIDKQFHDILQRFNIQKIESKGKAFDPKFHTAIATLDFKGKVPSGHVAEVPLEGYTIGTKILRLAKVVVAK